MLVIGMLSQNTHGKFLLIYISRDSFPSEHALDLRDVLLDVAGRSAAAGKSVVALRKLFVAVCYTCEIMATDTQSHAPEHIRSRRWL